MNEQEKEEEIQKALLYYEIIKSHEEKSKSKKSKAMLIILASLWAVVIGPLIVFFIESIYTSQKLPIVIQMPTSGLQTYVLVTTIYTFLFWFYVFYRITHPYECTCGYRTWFPNYMRRHINNGHKHDKTSKQTILHIIHLYRCSCGYFTWKENDMETHTKWVQEDREKNVTKAEAQSMAINSTELRIENNLTNRAPDTMP